LLEKKH
jgi:hypothetical protein